MESPTRDCGIGLAEHHSLHGHETVRRLSTTPRQTKFRMQKIVVLNPKGGSGKTTIAVNLASYFAVNGLRPTVMDMDAQGSSTRWLSKRERGRATIYGIAGFERNSRVTRSFATRLPLDTERLIVDTAAAVEAQKLPDLTRNATAVLVPVLPSDIDIHAAAKCISDLLLIAKIKREEQRIAVIANRVKKNTLIYKSLMRFLETLQIPVVTTLRDSQNYIRCAENGIGIFEMKPYLVREDLEQWLPLIGWLAQRVPLRIEPGTPAITSAYNANSGPLTQAATGPQMPAPPVVLRTTQAIGSGVTLPVTVGMRPAAMPAESEMQSDATSLESEASEVSSSTPARS
jgi:chromosome partitioning protein